jgi:hypothetical protein
MKYELTREIIDCLPTDRTLFHYFKDYYAVYLIRRELERLGSGRIAQLKQSRFAGLIAKPVIKAILAAHGNGEIKAEDFEALWPEDYETYVLTLGIWGDRRGYFASQTSRPGTNLVLQLNFCQRHDQAFRTCVANEPDLFNFQCHPISNRKTTLAWARIDLDLNTDEALIEEIQNDWLRDSTGLLEEYRAALSGNLRSFDFCGNRVSVDRVYRYFRDEIERHRAIWSEAMLNAALCFLLDEIGIGTVYYHSHDTGAAIKGIGSRKPPKSLYSSLPRQFCFERVGTPPEFLARDRYSRRRLGKIKNQAWFRMDAETFPQSC